MAQEYPIPQTIDGLISGFEDFQRKVNDPSLKNFKADRLPGAIVKLYNEVRAYRAQQERGELSAADIAAVDKLEAYFNDLTAEVSDDLEMETEKGRAANDKFAEERDVA